MNSDRAGAIRQEHSRDHERTRDLGIGRRGDPSRARGPPAVAPTNLESQADWFAQATTMGFSDAWRSLTAIAPSRVPSGVGHGRPLSDALRADLENRCGVDFSKVRIHDDARAAALAQFRGADAFTAGAHIFFGRGKFDARIPAGMQLLLHELAHVVQQLGTRSADGQLMLAQRGGTRAPQHRDVLRMKAPSPSDVIDFYLTRFVSNKPLHGEVIRWRDEIAKGHEPWSAHDTALESVAKKRVKLDATKGKDATLAADIKSERSAIAASVFDKRIVSFYIDVLKAKGKPAEAARWQVAFEQIETMFLDRATLVSFASQRNGSITALADFMWQRDKLFAAARPSKMAAALRGFFLGPGRDNPGLKAGGVVLAKHPLIGKGLADTKAPLPMGHSPADPLMRSEVHWGPVQAIHELDTFRLNLVRQLRAWVTKSSTTYLPSKTLGWVKGHLAGWFTNFKINEKDYKVPTRAHLRKYPMSWGFVSIMARPDLASMPGLRNEARKLLAIHAPAFASAVMPAISIWQSVMSINEEEGLKWESEGNDLFHLDPITNVKTLLPFSVNDVFDYARAGDSKSFKTFRKYLVDGLAKRMLMRRGGKLPTIAQHTALAKKEITRARDAGYAAFEERNAYLLASNKDLLAKPQVFKEVIANAWALISISQLKKVLGNYDGDADSETGTQTRNDAKKAELLVNPIPFTEPHLPGHTTVAPFRQRDRAGDRRLEHRSAIRDWIRGAGTTLGWDEVIAAGSKLDTPKSQKTIDIALLADWTWEPFADLAVIRKDFPRSRRSFMRSGVLFRSHDSISSFGPFSMRHVYSIFKAREYDEEASKIRELVKLARGSADVPKTSLVDQADTWMKSNFVRPQRAVLSDARVEFNRKTIDQYSGAVLAHPKTQDFLNGAMDASSRARDGVYVVPHYPPPALPLVLWAIPQLLPVTTGLRDDTELNGWVWDFHFGSAAPTRATLVPDVDYEKADTVFESDIVETLALYAAPPTRTQYDDPKQLSHAVWLVLLKVAIKSSTDKAKGLAEKPHDILGRVEERQRGAVEGSFRNLQLAQREATAVERNRRTRSLIAAMELYATNADGRERVDVKGEGLTYRNDMDALAYGWMQDFMPGVRPSADRLLHRAAWMFEVMDANSATRKRFRTSASFDLVSIYSVWTALALEHFENAAKRRILLSVLTDYDGKGNRYFTPDAKKTAVKNDEDRAAAREVYLTRQARRVKALDKKFAHRIDAWHKDSGLIAEVGTDADPGEIRRVGGAKGIPLNKEFFWGGKTPWAIRAVYNDFTYHPSVLPESDMLDPSNPRRYRGLSVVKVGGQTLNSAVRSRDDHKPIKLMLVSHGSFRKLITTKDELWLRKVKTAVTMSLIHGGPAGFLDAMKEVGNLILEVVEFIPGVGQGVALARLGYSIIDFIASGEFVDLMEALTEDPIEKIKEAVKVWKDRLSWANLVLFLLLGSRGPSKSKFGRPKKNEPRPVTKTGSGKARRLAYALMNVGLGVYRVVGSVRRRIQEAVFGTQLEIAERPLLRRLLLLMGSKWTILETIGKAMFGGLGSLSPAKLGEEVQKSMQSIFERISGFKLPKSIVKVKSFVSIVLEFIVSRFRGKKGLILQMGVEALKLIDQWKHVEEAISTPFKGLEPVLNEGWNGLVERFKGPMETGRETLRSGFNTAFGALSGLPGFSATLAKPSGDILSTTEVDADGEEVDAQLPRMDLNQAPVKMFPGAVPLPNLRSGKPIPGDIKPQVEGQMFQHFSDVRLHVSGSGDDFLKSMQAKGAAIDSHVILSSDLQISAGKGRDILMHELGHVAQNRSAPLSGPTPPAPKALPIKVGIRNDPDLEHHADAVVKLAKAQGVTGPLPIKTSRRGLRLNTGVIPRFLTALGGDEHIRSFRDEIDEKPPGGLAELKPSSVRAVKNVWSRIETLLKGNFGASKPYSFGKALIRGHIVDNAGIETSADKAIEHIARRVQKPQDPTVSDTNPNMWIDASLFMTELRRYLFARTGVLLDLKEKVLDIRIKQGKRTKKLPALDPNVPISKLHVRNINPGLLSAGSKLYKHLIQASFGNKMKDDTGKWVTEDDEHRRALRTQVVAYARSSLGPGMFSSGALKFKTTVVKEIRKRTTEKIAAKRTPSKLPDASIPKWADYKKTENGDIDSVHGSVGLRLSKFATKSKKYTTDAQWGTERESHHTTQFLLAEYFAHGADYKPNAAAKCAFKHLRADADAPLYPFIEVQSGMPKVIKNDRKNNDIADLAAGRGGPMPAILVARSTHRSGGLHVTSTAGDYADDVSTQSQVVNSEYRTALASRHADFKAAEDGSKADFKTYMETGPGSKAPEQIKIKAAVHGAMQATYQWMRGHMQGRLLPALLEHERTYYQTMAKAKETPGTTDDDLEFIHDETQTAKAAGFNVSRSTMATGLTTVASDAKTKNDDGMKAFGFFAT